MVRNTLYLSVEGTIILLDRARARPELGDLGVDLLHVETLDGVQHLLQRWPGRHRPD